MKRLPVIALAALAAIPTVAFAQTPVSPARAVAPPVVVDAALAPVPFLRNNCPEGRAANGQCANPVLQARMRQQAIVYTQPRLSFVSPPGVLPSGPGVIPFEGTRLTDRNYSPSNNTATRNYRELDFLFEREYYTNPTRRTTTITPVVVVTPTPVVTTPRTTTTAR